MTASVDELWLRSLQKLTAHVAHDLKGALNGVSVNLEVVRSRSERETSTGADVHKFAVSAADQLVLVIRATGALLALGRASKGPVEVTAIARSLAALLTDTSPEAHTRFEIHTEGGLAVETSAPVNAVRLALAEGLIAAASGKGQITVRLKGLPVPQIQISPATAPGLPSELQAALLGAGIRIATDGHGISMYLPGPAALPH